MEPAVPVQEHVTTFRVRYSETDQLGTFYNARVFEWFEVGRSELLRALGLPYTEFEARGAFLPLVEAHARYLGRARYDDQLQLTTRLSRAGKARLRFDAEAVHVEGGATVVTGWTVHAVTDRDGRPIRPPSWLDALLAPGPESP